MKPVFANIPSDAVPVPRLTRTYSRNDIPGNRPYSFIAWHALPSRNTEWPAYFGTSIPEHKIGIYLGRGSSEIELLTVAPSPEGGYLIEGQPDARVFETHISAILEMLRLAGASGFSTDEALAHFMRRCACLDAGLQNGRFSLIDAEDRIIRECLFEHEGLLHIFRVAGGVHRKGWPRGHSKDLLTGGGGLTYSLRGQKITFVKRSHKINRFYSTPAWQKGAIYDETLDGLNRKILRSMLRRGAGGLSGHEKIALADCVKKIIANPPCFADPFDPSPR